MLEWLFETIDYFIKIDKILVIRAHPAEISGTLPSKQKIYDELKRNMDLSQKILSLFLLKIPQAHIQLLKKVNFV